MLTQSHLLSFWLSYSPDTLDSTTSGSAFPDSAASCCLSFLPSIYAITVLETVLFIMPNLISLSSFYKPRNPQALDESIWHFHALVSDLLVLTKSHPVRTGETMQVWIPLLNEGTISPRSLPFNSFFHVKLSHCPQASKSCVSQCSMKLMIQLLFNRDYTSHQTGTSSTSATRFTALLLLNTLSSPVLLQQGGCPFQ